jgi:hypothetical protein
MKFQADKSDAQTITGYGPGWIAVDKQNSKPVCWSAPAACCQPGTAPASKT